MKKLKAFVATLPVASLVFGGVFAAVVGLSTVQPVAAQGIDGGIAGGASSAKGDGQPDNLDGQEGMFKRITDVMLFLTGAVSVIMLIIGGVRYVLSSGDQGAVTSAKNTILYAIVGIIVTILAYAIVNFVITQFAQS